MVIVVARRPSLVVVRIPRCPRTAWLGSGVTLESSFFSPGATVTFRMWPLSCAGVNSGDSCRRVKEALDPDEAEEAGEDE
jgi:hypothetical protein